MEQKKSLSQELEDAKTRFKDNNTPKSVGMFREFVENLESNSIANKALKPGDIAPGFKLKNSIGDMIDLSVQLKNGPVILTWYRGGWCPYCNLALNFLQQYLANFKAYGAQLIAITPEKPDQSLSTTEKHSLQFEVLTDETNEIAAKYAGVHGLPKNVRDFYGERGVGEHYSDYKNVEFPIPATYLIAGDGIIRYAFAESDYRKRAEPTEILEVLKELKK
jgi:peroxiredoxin